MDVRKTNQNKFLWWEAELGNKLGVRSWRNAKNQKNAMVGHRTELGNMTEWTECDKNQRTLTYMLVNRVQKIGGIREKME